MVHPVRQFFWRQRAGDRPCQRPLNVLPGICKEISEKLVTGNETGNFE